MYEQKQEKPKMKTASSVFAAIGGFIFSGIEAIVVALAISVVLYLFIMTPHEVVGTSMVPNFENGEGLIANKIIYQFSEPKQGDVIIFKFSDTQDFIKRIIAIPGDEVSIRDGKFYVNGEFYDESAYLDPTVYTSGSSALHEGETIYLEDDYYFAAGDNRPHSSDSREFGPIRKASIKGKAWIVYYPFENFRIVDHIK